MRLWVLLFFFGYFCLEVRGGISEFLPHNVERRSTNDTEAKRLWLFLGLNVFEPWSLSVGDSVVITCSLLTPTDKDIKIRLSHITLGAIQILTTEPASKGISHTLSSVALGDRGLYSCEGESSDPDTIFKKAYQLIWVKDPSQTVSLELLKVNRVKFFHDKTLTIGCQLQDDSAEWKIMSASEKTGDITECPDQERSGDLLSCTIPFLPYPVSPSRRYDPFWCESSTAQKSNVLNVTEAEMPDGRIAVATKFELTPAWFVRAGDDAVIQCKVLSDKHNKGDKFDLQLIWTKMGFGETNITVLVSQKASNPITYNLSNITHEHQGVYSCWDDGMLPEVYSLHWHHFLWVDDDSPAVTINVLSHNRTQFFHNEEMTVGCQLPTDDSQWKLMGFNKWIGIIKECDNSELSSSRLLTCTETMGYPWADRLYWCESATGLKSNLLNITNTVGFNVLEAPPLPVIEGDDLTLRCLAKNEVTGEIAPAPALFRLNSMAFGMNDDGNITLNAVTKEKEGPYNCFTKKEGNTHDTWITVKARPKKLTSD